MNIEQINKLREEYLLPDTCEDSSLIETHISWIVLTDNYAFKFKRPVKLSFLDFSTVEKRKYFCHREVELNSRLASGMYMGVFPVKSGMLQDKASDNDDETVDYAVQMKRMDNDREMDKLLKKNEVSESQLEKLARKIAGFHKEAKIIRDPFDTMGFQQEYADILTVSDIIANELGKEWNTKVEKCIERSKNYLNGIRSYNNERIISGFQRDCHGDLNASNIFLYDDPIIFDCIEFNDKFRHIDILNEIAFLCVDLDFYAGRTFSDGFYKLYLDAFGMEEDEMMKNLFLFYKSYRANIRAKVTLISMKDHPDYKEKPEHVKKYIELMEKYCRMLPQNGLV
jgi:uncharacterized protein